MSHSPEIKARARQAVEVARATISNMHPASQELAEHLAVAIRDHGVAHQETPRTMAAVLSIVLATVATADTRIKLDDDAGFRAFEEHCLACLRLAITIVRSELGRESAGTNVH
jgi:hypothetical protein